jgi:uncharacterized protein
VIELPTLEVAGQTLRVLPEWALLWEEEATLLLADTHWGKAATFRAAGLGVPRGTTGAGLARLQRALARGSIRRIVFLGDFLHAREGRAPGTLRALLEWRSAAPGLDLLLVRGNHDRGAGDPPPELGIVCVDPPYSAGAFTLAHHPSSTAGPGYQLAGHLHPALRLVGRARQRMRLPCFWFRPYGAVLPAFGDFTGSAIVQPEPGDRVFVIAGEGVMEV